MEVIIMPTAEKAEQLAAAIIADALRQKPNLTLGLATGATMENLYHKLAEMNKKGELDFSLCKTFNLDAISMLDVLYQVERIGKIKINRTAGLDVIHILEDLTFQDCVDAYYTGINKQ